MKFGFAPAGSVFLPSAPLMTKLVALGVLGAGPFACRDWKSLSALVVLVAAIGFARSAQGIFTTVLAMLVAGLLFLAGSSAYLKDNAGVGEWAVVLSAYGVGLYAIIMIWPFITAEELLDASRRSPRSVRRVLVWIVYVAVFFFKGEKALLPSITQGLRTSGIRASILNPFGVFRYIFHLFTALWLYGTCRAYAAVIAVRQRLQPVLGEFQPRSRETSLVAIVVIFLTLLACVIVVNDFVLQQFR